MICSTVEYQIGHDQKLIFLPLEPQQVWLGKIQKITKKGFTGEILQGLYFQAPNFDWFGQRCKAKNFYFWEMTSTFYNFPNCLTYQRMFWYQNPSKKVGPRSGGFFPSKTHFFFPSQNSKIWQFWDWAGEGQPTVKSIFCNYICVKKDCFYPIQVLEVKFFNFWFIPQRPKNWLKK